MKVKLSELRKIIKEELHRDYANSLHKKRRVLEAKHSKEDEDRDVREYTAPKDSDDKDVDEAIQALLPALGRAAATAAGSWAADKAVSKFMSEEEDVMSEEEEEGDVKDKSESVNESLSFDRFSRLW